MTGTGLLDGTSWSLADGEGVTIPEQVTMTIAFAGATASGSSGCNRFTGMYEERGRSMGFGPMATTRMACADEVMTAERAYLAALESVSSWSATDAELVLFDAAGDELLRYVASSAQ